MEQTVLTKSEQFRHGDIIRVVSNESNCGIDQTVFMAIVVDTKEGLIAIPQDFQGHLFNSVKKGSSWETRINWLLGNDVKVYLIERYDDLFIDLMLEELLEKSLSSEAIN